MTYSRLFRIKFSKLRLTEAALCLACSILLFSSLASADYHYVSHFGTDEYPYTSWESAAWSVQDAVDASSSGDSVYIDAGEWNESIVVPEQYSAIALLGKGVDSTMIYWDSINGHVISPMGADVLLENIHFSKLGTGNCIYSYYGYNGGLAIDNCRFTGGGIFTWKKYVEISNSEFVELHRDRGAIHIESGEILQVRNCYFRKVGGDAVSFSGTGDCMIRNNIIISIRGWAAQLYTLGSTEFCNNIVYIPDAGNPYELGRGVKGGGLTSSIVTNNTFAFHRGSAYQSCFWVADGGQYINNSIDGVYNVFNYISEEESAIINYNNIWDVALVYNHAYGEIDSVGNIYSEPMFIAENDFHLQAYSPLINTGDPEILDIDGSRSDIGVFGGPGGESYEYMDLPPAVPDSLNGFLDADSIIITWRYNYESDFSRYLVHRDTTAGFEPLDINIIAEPETSIFIDQNVELGKNYYYRIASIDNQNNRSDYSDELSIIQTGLFDFIGAEIPQVTAVLNNYPNPFNTQTMIEYSVANLGPIPAEINIDIYDILGRKVRSLVNDQKGVGIYRAIWDGRSDSGDACPSGIYFTKISQWGVGILSNPRKIVLLK